MSKECKDLMNDKFKIMAPGLSNIGNKNPFTTPEGYFDSFSEKMQKRLEKENDNLKITSKRGIFQLFKPYLAFAAIFIGAFMLVYWPVQNIVNKNRTVAEIESNEYIMEQLEWSSLWEFVSMTEQNSEGEEPDQSQIEDYLVASASDFDIYFEY